MKAYPPAKRTWRPGIGQFYIFFRHPDGSTIEPRSEDARPTAWPKLRNVVDSFERSMAQPHHARRRRGWGSFWRVTTCGHRCCVYTNTMPNALVPCERCFGSGRLPGFRHIDGGVCFRCGGAGMAKPIRRRVARKVPVAIGVNALEVAMLRVRVARFQDRFGRDGWAYCARIWARMSIEQRASLTDLDILAGLNCGAYIATTLDEVSANAA